MKTDRQKPVRPPQWAEYLMEFFIPLHRLEVLQGDLYELFYKRVEQEGLRRARLLFIRDVLQLLRPQLWQEAPASEPRAGSFSLYFHYLLVAFRNLKRSRFYPGLNVSGLAIGIATCVTIVLYVLDELSYDRYSRKADRIYRIVAKGRMEGTPLHFPVMGPSVARDLLNDYPEITEATRLRMEHSAFINSGTTTFKEDRFAYVDSNFFQVFTIPFLKGNAGTALVEPNTVVITQSMAQKYFRGQNPIGQVLFLGPEKKPLRVTGLIEKVPANSHFHYDLFASLASVPGARGQSWTDDVNYFVYLVLAEDFNYKQLEAKMPRVVEKYMGPELESMMGVNLKQFIQKGNEIGFELQPLLDIHLHSALQMELEPNGDIRYVYVFSTVALFVLLIACINFMNLSTARASLRAKEVGVRKVLGSLKEQLIGQFLLESVLLALFALVLAVVLVYLTLPYFNALTGKELRLNLKALPLLLPGGLLLGIAAGCYPAFVLSAFRPATALKGTFTSIRERINLRGALVVFQFFVATTLIVATIVVYRQLQYMQHKALGFDREQTLVIHDTQALGQHEAVLKTQLQQLAGVRHVSVSGFVPVGESHFSNNVFQPEGQPGKNLMLRLYGVDPEYIPAMGMQLVQGRNFSAAYSTDSSGIIINQAALKSLGLGDNPLGKKLFRDMAVAGQKRTYTIIGVVKDFHVESLHKPIVPLVMLLGQNAGSILVKLKAGTPSPLLATIKTHWNTLAPGTPFAYSFLDQRFESVYRTEQKTGEILSLFAQLTIFIACLGLLGLASFSAERRRKEMSIRKVLGASAGSIMALLTRDFLKLVLLANLLAWPVAWYASRRWLEGFAYQTQLSWWFFVLAGGLAVMIALLTVSYQSLKAARANPGKLMQAE